MILVNFVDKVWIGFFYCGVGLFCSSVLVVSLVARGMLIVR